MSFHPWPIDPPALSKTATARAALANLTDADLEILLTLAERLKTQDNRITQDPLFVVYDYRRVFGLEKEATDDYVWVDSNGEQVDDVLVPKLEALSEAVVKEDLPDDIFETDGEDDEHLTAFLKGCKKCYFTEVREFKTAALTEAAAQQYINSNAHNLDRPFIFVHGLDRVKEMQDLRRILLTLAPAIDALAA